MPVDALIGKTVSQAQESETRELIFNYLDLCNEQIFLRKKNKIAKDTWRDWSSGMESHLQKVAFKLIWDEIKDKSPGRFSFLEQLENEDFKIDPKRWS
ncbi:MAG: hypothetical protein ACI93R_002421 [Flavobacteriales bacterium]|jgi:hypothetical protein